LLGRTADQRSSDIPPALAAARG